MIPDARQRLRDLSAQWRKEAKEIDAATSGLWIEPGIKLECAAELDAVLAASRSDEYYLSMAALDRYPIEDGLPKSTSVVFRIHQLGHALEKAQEARPAPPLDWQPIATAPKDGSAILSIVAGKIPFVCWWIKTVDGFDGFWRGDAGYRVYPSHWMPLPVPPAAHAAPTE